jgi:hypothetical protein
MTSEQRRQESEAYWFRSPAARNVLEDFGAARDDEEETILTEEGQEPEPVTLTPETSVEDVVRNEPEPPPQEFTDVYEFFASQQGKDLTQERYEERGIEGYEVGELFPREQRGLGGEAGAGFARGVDQTQAMGFGLLGLMGEALGVEGLSDLGVDGYIRNMEEAAKNQASVQDPFEEIGGAGDAARYATGIIFEQLPQLALSLVGGGIGGYTARSLASKVVANEIGRRIKAGAAKEVAESDVAQMVAERMLRGAGTKIVESSTKSGALGGAYVANVGQIAGGSFGEIEQETGLRDPVNALGFALLGGALETGAEALLAAPIAGKLMRGTTAPMTGATERALGFNVGPVVGAAGRLAGTSAAEGGTEYGQTFTEQAAVASADPNRTLAEVAFTPEAERERQISAAAGVVAGGGIGAVSQAASYLIPETSRRVQEKLQQRQVEQAPAEPTLTGEWSQPIQVDDLRMQRSSTGLWAVVNPDREIVRGAPTIQDESGATLQILSPEADEEGRAAMLVARAEKALSDLSEGEMTTELPAQQEEVVEEDELGEPAELDEETEATRMRQSPLGAQALREQLAENEVVSAALAEPTENIVEQPAQPIKSAEESAQTIASELEREAELRRSEEGAEALRRQLAEEQEVSAALADNTQEPRETGTPTILKSAAESAEAIDAALSEEEQVRQGEVGAGVRKQARRQERVASRIMAPDVDVAGALQRVREGGVVGEQADILLSNFYEKRKKELETAQEDRRKASEAALARPPIEAENFIRGLNTGDRVGLIGGQDRTATVFVDGVKKTKKVIGGRNITPIVFVGRRKNGNAVFETFATSPVDGGQVGSRTRIELPPAQFARVTLAPPPEVTKTPLEQAFSDALGPNPTKQQAERVLGSPYTGTRGAQESTFNDGLGAEAFPIEVSWFNKKGEKGTIIPSIRGKFTNTPFNTVRQMNQGLEVVVPDDQLATLNKDIEVQAVSDKKGGRKNIVTGVNLWGRTYRRSLRSPKDFSVNEGFAYSGSEGQSQRDIAEKLRGSLLTQEQATKLLSNLDQFGRRSDSRKTRPRKSGLLIFNDIYKSAPERIARSEAAVRGREERQTPPEEQLKEWELVQAGLNPVEYTFYEDALARVTDFITRSNLPENVKDEARFEAQNSVVKAFANRKKRRGKQPAGDTADLSKLYLESLAGLRQTRLENARQRATRLIGNIERNPERMSDVEIARADDADPLRGPVLGSVAGPRAAEIEERAINEAEKGNAVDLDRAVQTTLKRLAELRPDRTTKQVFNDRAAVRAIAETYKNLGKFNPIYTAMGAVKTADRSIRRREMNQQTELITDREARERAGRQGAQEPATTQEFAEGELARAEQAETVQAADRAVLPEQPEVEVNEDAAVVSQPDEPLSEDFEAARERFYNLSDGDRDLIFRFERQILDERGRPVRGQKSDLTQAQKRRAKLIRRYIKEGGAELENQINEGKPRAGRGSAVPANANISGGSAVGRELSGANRSLARGTAVTATQGRPESVGGPDRGGAGTATGASVRGDGRPSVRASLAPTTVRQLSRRAKRIFIQSFGRLTDAESVALTDAEIDRAYQSIVTRSNPAAVKAGKVVFVETPNSFADLAGLSASELLAGSNAARRSADEVRAVRENVAELLRARAFADVGTFLETVQQGRFSQDMKLRAREFAKLARRGVDLNGVGVQIARFGGDSSWSGLFTRDGSNAYDIALNLDTLHDRDSAVNTFLHELSHVTTSKKVRGEIKLNRVEQDALNRLEALRREALVAAARDLRLDVPTTLTDADYTRLAKDLDNRALPQNDPEGANRVYAGLTNLEEFTTEVSSSPELADLMVRLGFGQAKGRVSLLNAVRDAWNALVELIAGIKADPNSPLAKAFKDSWIINFSNAGGDVNLGEYTMPEVRRSAINRERARVADIEDYINREVEARNLEGTTEQRRAIAQEVTGPADQSAVASARRVRDAARSLTEPQFVQWAQDNGFNFVDPALVWRNNNATPQQAARDTVQVAESRAVSPQSQAEQTSYKIARDFLRFAEERSARQARNPDPEYKRATLAGNEDALIEQTLFLTSERVFVRENPDGTAVYDTTHPFYRHFRTLSTKAGRERVKARLAQDVREILLGGPFSPGFGYEFPNFYREITGQEPPPRPVSDMPAGGTTDPVLVRPDVAESRARGNMTPEGRAKWDNAEAYAERLSRMTQEELDNVEFDENPFGYELWEARKLISKIPANSPKFKKVTDDNTNVLWRNWEYVANVNGDPYGVNRYEDPDDDEEIVYAFGPIYPDDPPTETTWGKGFESEVVKEMVAHQQGRQVAESRARGRVWRPVTRRTPTGGTITQGGMFAVDELLDKKAGDLYRSSRMAIKVDVATIEDLSRLLERQMKKFYKGQTPPVETINTALGNLDNPLTPEQIAEIERMRLNGQTNQAAKKRDQYIRDNRRNFKQNKQTQALAQLPEELAATIREMSSHIESLSRRLPNEGLVNGDLAITVDEALGTYLNRSYAIFDDPQWADRVRKDPKVMDAARKYISNSLVKAKTEELIVNAAEDGRTLSREDASALANDSVTEDEVENLLEGYLAVGQEAPTIEVLSGRIPGQKNLSMFYQRGNIAPEIQALWGRYEDPKINYAKTVMKLSSVIANDNFLKELRDIGIEEGWLWSRENNPDDTRHPPGYVRISTEKNPSLTPLGGMYAHPMLAEGLFKMFPVGGAEEHYWWLRSAMKLTGISMATKTVGSVASQIRNYLGNYLNLVATGNFGLRDLASGDFARRFRNSNDTVLANTFGKYRNMSRAEWRTKIDDYVRRGVVGESITTGLLEDLLTASRRAGSPDFGDVVWNKVGEPFKRVADFAVRTYSSGDDWFKVMIYEAEQDKYRQAYPDWDDNKVKEKAAEIARDIHWTYSLAPAIVQDLKKFPFIAPFVTFTSEVIRTTYNLQKLARQEIMEGRATGNKELEAIGWKRVRGMTTAAFLPAAVGSAAMAMAGISGEDEEDLRRFLPDWQKNSQLILFRKENGEIDFVDISFLDPYEYFKKPLVAFTRSLRNADNADEILLKGTMDMVRQALDPFTSEQIFAGAIMDVMRNRDAAGRQVYNPQDTGANIGLSVARKIFYDPFIPGTVNSAERIGKAAFGIESETGRAYNLFNEIASVTLGQRVSSVDAQQALQFKSSRFMREIRDASALFNREFTSQGTRSASDVVDGYERSNAARRGLIDSIRRDYLAAIRLGVSVQRAKAILRDGGLGGDTIKMVTTGIYKPYDASKQSLDLVRARGKNDRVSAYNQARRSAAPREVLADR